MLALILRERGLAAELRDRRRGQRGRHQRRVRRRRVARRRGRRERRHVPAARAPRPRSSRTSSPTTSTTTAASTRSSPRSSGSSTACPGRSCAAPTTPVAAAHRGSASARAHLRRRSRRATTGSSTYSRDGPTATASRSSADGEPLGELVVPLGVKAATNAAGAAAIALELGVAVRRDRARRSRGFGGVARRFQHRGERDGVTFVDDYAHLPGEVAAAIATARQGGWRRVDRGVPAAPLHAHRVAVARLRRRVRRRRRGRAHRRVRRGRDADRGSVAAGSSCTRSSTRTPSSPSRTCRVRRRPRRRSRRATRARATSC